MRLLRTLGPLHRTFQALRVSPRSLVFQITVRMTLLLMAQFVAIHYWMVHQMGDMMTQVMPNSGISAWISTAMVQKSIANMVMSLPVLVAAIAVMVWWSLRPLRQFSRMVHQSLDRDLSQNPSLNRVRQWPDEMNGMVQGHHQLTLTLTEMGTQQRQFINNVSHELRTSLSVVLGYLQQMLRRSSGLSVPQQEALEIAASETQRTVQLLQDLLDLARSDTRGIPLHVECLSLNAVIDDAVKLVPARDRSRIQVEAMDSLIVHTDRLRLLQILRHLLDNALNHSIAPVILSIEVIDDGVAVQVSDRGAGMAVPSPTGGVSLSLAIVETLVHRIGGDLSIHSEPGQGSRICVELRSARSM